MVNSLWFQWKSLKLPWRKSRLAGVDLAGNTFWEYREDPNANRWRRMLKPDPKMHLSDVQVTPQWHQWLRYVREHAPTVEEQQQEVTRQLQIKQLARLADERWASKASYLDQPQPQNASPTPSNTPEIAKLQNASPSTESTPSQPKPAPESNSQKEPNPWAQADRRNPGESWQPSGWSPQSKR